MTALVARVARRAGRLLCRFRGTGFGETLAAAAEAFAHQLGNENFDARRNGEHRVMRLLQALEPKTLFDVGANVGEWSRQASSLYPQVRIHAFEIVPSTVQSLREKLADLSTVEVLPFGLSDRTGALSIHVPDEQNASTMATAFPAQGINDPDGASFYKRALTCEARRADEYIRQKGIEAIDFVKIDVEGMDLRVIKGFGDELHRVTAIQFEYGAFNVASHDLLGDYCNYLHEHGFAVGKIYPRVVQFFDYTFQHDNLYGTNFLAVKQERRSLIDRLSRYGAP